MSSYFTKIIFCFFISIYSFKSYAVELKGGWEIFVNNQSLQENSELSFSWKEYKSEEQIISVEYQNEFSFSKSRDLDIVLILPPNWIGYSLEINGKRLITQDVGKFKGNIYQYQIINLDLDLLQEKNTIKLLSTGSKQFGGFRGKSIIVTHDKKTIRSYVLLNFFLNHVHTLAIAFNLASILFCLALIRFNTFKIDNILLITIMLSTIPYHLLTTEVYELLSIDSLTPFKIQLTAQLFLWPAVILFYLLQTSAFSIKIRTFLSNIKYFKIAVVSIAFVSVLFLLSDHSFFLVLQAFIGLFFALSITALFFMRQNYLFIAAYSVSVCVTSLAVASEFTGINAYLLVYSWLILSLMGLYDIYVKTSEFTEKNQFLQIFSQQFVPQKVFHETEKLSLKKLSMDEIVGKISGSTTLSTVLIDICDWGKLNSYENSKIPASFINQARIEVFKEIELIMSMHHLELLKSSGDNMKFCGGLFLQSRNRETEIANSTLKAISVLLDSIHHINAALRAKNLPVFDLKISATLGVCFYGFEKYSIRGQFDTQGHFVNMAYRMEQYMGKEFYESYGKNVALVSDTLIRQSDDMQALSRFSETFEVNDKHGLKYQCFVGLQSKKQVKLEDFSQAMYNYFQPSADSSLLIDNVTPIRPVSNIDDQFETKSHREASRENFYLGENLLVDITIGNRQVSGQIIDFSTNGVGILVPFNESENFEVNMIVTLKYKIINQNFEGSAKIVRVVNRTIRNQRFKFIGVKVEAKERKSSERKLRRFPCCYQPKPTAWIESSYGFKKNIHFYIENISKDGIELLSLDAHVAMLVGLKLSFHLQFPFSQTICIMGEVTHMRPTKNGKASVGVRVVDATQTYDNVAATYILKASNGEITIKELKNAGFNISAAKSVMTCTYQKTESEMQEICDLRLKVWQGMGYFKDVTDPKTMIDDFDQSSRQIMIRFGSKLACSARVVFNNGQLDQIEHAKYGANIPEWLLKEKFVEYSRVIIDPEYRSADVFRTILYHMARVTIESGHKYVLMSCNNSLMTHYTKFGFKQVNKFKGDDGEYWNLAVCDLLAHAQGWAVNPIGWALGFEELNKQLALQGVISINLMAKMNQSINKFVQPIVEKKISGRK